MAWTYRVLLCQLLIPMILLSSTSAGTTGAKLNTVLNSDFTAMTAVNGSSLCALGTPSLVVQTRSLIRCSSACIAHTGVCKSFNFRQGCNANCELFFCQPRGHSVVTDCQNFYTVGGSSLIGRGTSRTVAICTREAVALLLVGVPRRLLPLQQRKW